MEDDSLSNITPGELPQQQVQFLPINRPESPPHSRRRRAYQSCEPCRKRKSRCVPDKGEQRQPCKRCVGGGLNCDFRSTRTASRRSTLRSANLNHGNRDENTQNNIFASSTTSRPHLMDYQRPVSPESTPTRGAKDPNPREINEAVEPSEVTGHGTSSTPGDPSPSMSEPTARSRIISAQLHNTADALDLLTFTAAGERNRNNEPDTSLGQSSRRWQPGHGQSTAMPPLPGVGASRDESNSNWVKFVMIKRQILTKNEVLEYLDFYFDTIWSLRPIVPSYFRDKSRYFTLAIDEPMLLVGLVTLASRYHHLSGSHGEIRSERIHWQAWNLFKKYLQSALWGSPQTRSSGAIAAMLLLVEWHPKSINNPTAFDEENSYDLFGSEDSGRGSYDAGSQPLTALTSQQRYGMATLLEDLNIIAPAYRSNKMSW